MLVARVDEKADVHQILCEPHQSIGGGVETPRVTVLHLAKESIKQS